MTVVLMETDKNAFFIFQMWQCLPVLGGGGMAGLRKDGRLHAARNGTKMVLCLVTATIFCITWRLNRSAESGSYPGLFKKGVHFAKILGWLMCTLQLEKQQPDCVNIRFRHALDIYLCTSNCICIYLHW